MRIYIESVRIVLRYVKKMMQLVMLVNTVVALVFDKSSQILASPSKMVVVR